MKLRIADCGLRIACRVVVPLMLLTAAMALSLLLPLGKALSQSADAPPDAAVPPATQPVRPLVPITFARSGCNAVIKNPMTFNRLVKRVALSAFGRTWTEATLSFDSGPKQRFPYHYQFETTVPAVRVPTVFSVIPTDAPPFELCQIVAYPDQDVVWDKKIVLMAAGPPEWEWFRQWAAAIGLPVTWLPDDAKVPADLPRPSEDQQALLILGRSRTGKDLSGVARLVENTRINVLVLEADWLGDAAGPVEVGGGQMRGDLLAVTGKQSWRGPLQFRFCRRPCGAVMNRWAWILGKDGLPLVEAVAVAGTPLAAMRPVVLSYVPWAEQLGRNESADATLLAILSAAAKAEPPKIAGHPVEFIYPKKTELNAKDRPVLSAVRSVEPVPREDRKPDYNPPIYSILDLRGKDEIRHPDGDLSEICRNSIGARQAICKLLILGDDPMLDEWEWLKLDRAKKQIGAAGVQWLPDDELPPSKESQIRLMLTLTELGVPLGTPEQEEERK